MGGLDPLYALGQAQAEEILARREEAEYKEKTYYLNMLKEYVDEGLHDLSGVPIGLEAILADMKTWCEAQMSDQEVALERRQEG